MTFWHATCFINATKGTEEKTYDKNAERLSRALQDVYRDVVGLGGDHGVFRACGRHHISCRGLCFGREVNLKFAIDFRAMSNAENFDKFLFRVFPIKNTIVTASEFAKTG